MELILISNSKLKIMLSAEDMKTYNIECDGDTALRRGFKPVLERAHSDCGFDIDSGRLLVQVFPSRGGGCEMFVTRVAPSANGENACGDASVCIFDTLQYMICASRALALRGFGGESAAYAMSEGAFALILPEFDREERLPTEAAVLEEFGCRRDCENIEGYIKEHARPIFEKNAVERLAEFF